MPVRSIARALCVCVCAATLIGAAGCKQEGGVKVRRLQFEGLKAVEPGQLKSVLATAASSKLPWGEKRYFSREQFEADLKRIAAFYHDRGFPDARVASFDAKLSADQSSVDILLNISEGEPVVAERVELVGFDGLAANRRTRLNARLPLKPGQPMDRALMQASRETALDELKDQGYPYASVRLTDGAGSGDRKRILTLAADPGPIAHHGPLEIQGNSSISDGVIERQLTFKTGDLFRQSCVLES